MSDNEIIMRAAKLSERIGKLLAGQCHEIQGIVLTGLTAMWIKGHIDPEDIQKTKAFRRELLEKFGDCVRELVEDEELEGTTLFGPRH